jgi:hypothetical protein
LTKQALVAGAGGPKQQGKAAFTVTVNGKEAAKGQVTEDNPDVLQQFDLTGHVRTVPDEVSRQSAGAATSSCCPTPGAPGNSSPRSCSSGALAGPPANNASLLLSKRQGGHHSPQEAPGVGGRVGAGEPRWTLVNLYAR